jgi:NAD(P)-dependent dehydrogenase (short-subunit alcohol dehydrogenase family)
MTVLDSFRLDGKVAVVTGGNRGLGRAFALALGDAGATIAIVARDAAASSRVVDELTAAGVRASAFSGDVGDRASVVAVADQIAGELGRVDVLVNNAGVGPLGYLHELTADDVERVYDTNVVAVADLTRMVLPDMLRRGDGAVIMLSSVAAWASVPPMTAYASSKFAVDGLIEGLRRETWGTGVLVHSINPGPIATDYLARAANRSPQPGDPPRSSAPGFPASWVADAVVDAAGARRPVTRSVPRVAGVVRLAQVPPVGAVLDLVFGLFGRLVTDRVRGLAQEQARGVRTPG